LTPGKPLAERIEQHHNREPDGINAQQAKAVSAWLVGREWAKQPAGLRPARPCEHHRHRVDNGDMNDIIEEWNTAESRNPFRQPAACVLDRSQQQQLRPDRHGQIQQRWRVFFAVDKGQEGGDGAGLRAPGRGIAVDIGRTQQHESDHHRATQSHE
jgi:hypothetical protein